ncbi:HAD hydrolase-like protein, partial [Pseudomonas aeruginosa]
AEHCLMIGDRMHDLLGASRHGVACIGVGSGCGSEDELRAHQPTQSCADLAALRQVVESH